jgi:spermidine/putrescine transport system substrate-binding protein
MVSKFAAQDLAEKLDKANIPNIANIDPGLMGLYYDKGNEYSVGYFWGTTGLAYDSSKVKEPITSWKQVLEPNADLQGKIGMLDDMRELLGVGLRYKGFSANATKEEEIGAGKQVLIDQKKHVKVYADSPGNSTNLVSGDVVVAMMYTNDAATAINENPAIKYVIPTDVSTIWQDNMVIPKGAPSKYTAEVFINFMLRADIAAQNANDVGSGTPNAAALKQGLIDAKWVQDPTIYPDMKAMGNKLEWLVKGDPKVDELYDRAYQEIKAAS